MLIMLLDCYNIGFGRYCRRFGGNTFREPEDGDRMYFLQSKNRMITINQCDILKSIKKLTLT